PFVRNNHPIYFMDVKSAEMTKYAANAMLAVRISFMNEIANLCDSVGADVNMVRKGIGSDKRIGMSFLYPGIGYGGSCFPKDVKALIKTAEDNRHDFSLLKSVDAVNEKQKIVLVEKMRTFFKDGMKGKTIALWGLAFKPETDDIREAPALRIIEEVLSSGGNVRATDPEAIRETKKILGDRIEFLENPYEALQNADALVLATEWNEYRNPDWEKMKKTMHRPVIFDGRNIYRDIISGKGFDYFCIGSNLRNA
ncbi:MAG: UDP-glucose/GDP-mannose dehydrogenase family protein, partial [Spirochaetia bacterium]|nr:UDP-glucose/GDP-mannose dehydrogenase family protein [Spirochaetia bacterium]